MKTLYKKLLSGLFISLFASLSSFAQDFVAVAKNGNIYDEANAKYITLNQNNDEISVIPGMVFKFSQHTPGWYKVEYSPGIHAFIPEQITASGFKPVQAGSYDIQNFPGHKLNAQLSGNDWSASVDGKTYKGEKVEDIIIFTDSNNKIAYSLVDIGNGPIAISYDNSITKFF